jgi:tetratricopeptide (TPR) repeat protein
MAIQGSLREASLPDVVQLLFLGRRTGRLALADRQRHAAIWFEDGLIIHAAIVNRRDRLGDMLVKSGPVSQAQLDEALAMQASQPTRRVGDILVDTGAITRELVNEFVRRHVEEALFALFSWASGTFRFEAGVRPEPEDIVHRFSPEAVLLEGARRVDEWSQIEKKIPSFDLVFAPDPEAAGTRHEDLALSDAQRLILPLLNGARDVRELVEDSALSEFTACQALFGLIAAGLVRTVGVSTPPEAARAQETRIEEHRNLGIAFYRTGMLEEAEREFRRVRELRHSEGGAPFFLGLIALRSRRWEEGIALLREAGDRGGPRAAIFANLAVGYEELHRWEEADAAWAEAARRAPEDARILLGWGLLALRRGDIAVAGRRIQQARERFGERLPPLWYWAAARAHASADALEEAIEVARGGVQAYPDEPVLRNTLAVLFEITGEFADAERLVREALDEDTSLPQLSKNLGDLCYRSGRFDQAAEAYERAIRLAPTLGDDIYFRLGNLAFRRRELDRAREYWEEAVRLNPAHHLARANLETLPVAR